MAILSRVACTQTNRTKIDEKTRRKDDTSVISTTLGTHEIPAIAEWFMANFQSKILRKRKSLNARIEKNKFLKNLDLIKNDIDYQLQRAVTYQFRRANSSAIKELGSAFEFMAISKRIFDRLEDEEERKRFINRIAGSIQDQHGVRPLNFEFGMYVHFLRRSLPTEFCEITQSGRFDFLINVDGLAIEVECKSISPEKGLKIKIQDTDLLANEISLINRSYFSKLYAHCFLVTLDKRLLGTYSEAKIFSELLLQCLHNGEAVGAGMQVNYAKTPMTMPNVFMPDESRGLNLIRAAFDIEADLILMHQAGGREFIFAFRSNERPDIASSIYETISEASEQFTGTRPAMIAIELPALSPTDMQELIHTRSALYSIAGRFWKNGRNHVNHLCFVTPKQIDKNILVNTYGSGGVVGLIEAPNPIFSSIGLDKIFGMTGVS